MHSLALALGKVSQLLGPHLLHILFTLQIRVVVTWPRQHSSITELAIVESVLFAFKITRFLNDLYTIVLDALRLQTLDLGHGPGDALKTYIDIILSRPRVVLRRSVCTLSIFSMLICDLVEGGQIIARLLALFTFI